MQIKLIILPLLTSITHLYVHILDLGWKGKQDDGAKRIVDL